MIFVDADIPLCLVGWDRRRKAEARRLLELRLVQRERLVTDAAVFQEMSDHYAAHFALSDRPAAMEPAFQLLKGIADEIFPVEAEQALAVPELMLAHPRLPAREALHASVMRRHEVSRVLGFSQAFELVPGIRREL